MRAGRRELALLAVALGLGLLADLMLRTFPLGLNATVVVTGVTIALLAIRRGGDPWARGAYVVAALAIGAAFCWRDSPVLKTLDALAACVVLALLASDDGESPTLSRYLLRTARTSAYVLPGPLPALGEVPWSNVRSPVSWRVACSLARGTALALPIVAVFAVLLASADTLFADRLKALFDVDVPDLLSHAAGTVVFGWTAAGLLWAAFSTPAGSLLPPRPRWLALGGIEVGMVLGLLDLLFAGFVWVQLRYFFGGASWVQSVGGLTYSQYARRGFFELVAVTALVLPLLLAAHWLLDHSRTAARRVVLGLAALQVGLVMVVLASALERMRLYRAHYGQTELRFYTTAFMLWLGVLLVSFLLTVLPGARGAFAQVAAATAFVALALLHAVNPDERIVVANRDAPAFDLEYELGLSADAVPALIATAPSLTPLGQKAMAERLRARWSGPEADLRTWNLARRRARQEVAQADWTLAAAIR